MEFGIFNAISILPRYREAHGAAAEHDRLMDEVAFIMRRRRRRDQVRLGLRAPLPHRLLAPLGQRVVPGLLRGAGRPTSTSARASSTSRRRPTTRPASPSGWRCWTTSARAASSSAPAAARPPPSSGASASGPRADPGDGGRDPARDRARCGARRALRARRPVLLHARAQRAAQALHPAPPAAVDGRRQPEHLRAGRPARRGRARASPSPRPRCSPRSSPGTRR